MGKQKVKTWRDMLQVPIKIAQTVTSLTPAVVTNRDPGGLGVLPIGVYKGQAAFLDLDKLVNQPLVLAEAMHIEGILDGREEDYDLQTLVIPNASAIGASVTGTMTVPAGKVWYINTVELTLPADAGGSPAMNWYNSQWIDRVGSAAAGQPFHPAAVNFTPAGGIQLDEFSDAATLWAVANQQSMLRLPSGTVLTFVATNTVAIATAAMTCSAKVYGFETTQLCD